MSYANQKLRQQNIEGQEIGKNNSRKEEYIDELETRKGYWSCDTHRCSSLFFHRCFFCILASAFKWFLVAGQQPVTSPKHSQSQTCHWVNYNHSLTWTMAIWAWFPYENQWFQWGRSEVVIKSTLSDDTSSTRNSSSFHVFAFSMV